MYSLRAEDVSGQLRDSFNMGRTALYEKLSQYLQACGDNQRRYESVFKACGDLLCWSLLRHDGCCANNVLGILAESVEETRGIFAGIWGTGSGIDQKDSLPSVIHVSSPVGFHKIPIFALITRRKVHGVPRPLVHKPVFIVSDMKLSIDEITKYNDEVHGKEHKEHKEHLEIKKFIFYSHDRYKEKPSMFLSLGDALWRKALPSFTRNCL